MDIKNTSAVSDDQELAKVLESMNQQATPAQVDVPASDASQPAAPADELAFEETQPQAEPVAEDVPAPVSDPVTPIAPVNVSTDAPELDSIKKVALEELRPLVDKLNLPADEKFDTLLLLIRSTDDKSLVGAAHEAARGIEDETKRAQALLDVIKEIDYFAAQK